MKDFGKAPKCCWVASASAFGALMLCLGIANMSSGAEVPGPMLLAHNLVDRVEAKKRSCWQQCGRLCRGRARRSACGVCLRECNAKEKYAMSMQSSAKARREPPPDPPFAFGIWNPFFSGGTASAESTHEAL